MTVTLRRVHDDVYNATVMYTTVPLRRLQYDGSIPTVPLRRLPYDGYITTVTL